MQHYLSYPEFKSRCLLRLQNQTPPCVNLDEPSWLIPSQTMDKITGFSEQAQAQSNRLTTEGRVLLTDPETLKRTAD